MFFLGRPVAGMLYPVTTHTDGSGTYITYSESTGAGSPHAQWRGRSGNLGIHTLDMANHRMSVDVSGVVFEPDPSFGGNTAVGTFQFDGTGSVDSVTGL
jgi:hypothetical protein